MSLDIKELAEQLVNTNDLAYTVGENYQMNLETLGNPEKSYQDTELFNNTKYFNDTKFFNNTKYFNDTKLF